MATSTTPPTCSILMQPGSPCGRAVHSSATSDPGPRCLLHSEDTQKESGPLLQQFLQEIESVLQGRAGELADFTSVIFPDVDFRFRHFHMRCNFFAATFQGVALFAQAVFLEKASFEHAHFKEVPDFRQAQFTGDADFFESRFHKGACFAEVIFESNAFFSNAKFNETADFHSARFLHSARFRLTQFGAVPQKPTPVFSLALFSQPNTLFYKTHLEQALFINCDISRINFSSVHWRTRRGSGKRMLFEEELPLDSDYAMPLKADDGTREYRLISETYQQLKKNYDQRRDYWTAGDFHYGEMEMQRLSIRSDGRWLFLRRWWHPHLSLLAWYRFASHYGESYSRPSTLIFVVLAMFTLFFPLQGLKRADSIAQPAAPLRTYRSVWPSKSSSHDKLWAEAKLVGKSAIMSLDTATFERAPEYIPQYPWGRVAAIIETALTSALFALFLLAIRRQFRR
jgi:uncharacterized protein YjbI with pentapeptide repeats